MDYAKILMESADLLKYQIFEYLSQPEICDATVAKIAASMGRTYQSVYYTVNEMVDEIADRLKRPAALVKDQLLRAFDLPISKTAYRSYLVTRSISFTLLHEIVVDPRCHYAEFIHRHAVSDATTQRKLLPLIKALAEVKIELNLVNMGLMGNEVNIRLELAKLYWWVFGSGRWPFEGLKVSRLAVELQQLAIVPPSFRNDLPAIYLLAITHLRSQQVECHQDDFPKPLLRNQIDSLSLSDGAAFNAALLLLDDPGATAAVQQQRNDLIQACVPPNTPDAKTFFRIFMIRR